MKFSSSANNIIHITHTVNRTVRYRLMLVVSALCSSVWVSAVVKIAAQLFRASLFLIIVVAVEVQQLKRIAAPIISIVKQLPDCTFRKKKKKKSLTEKSFVVK